MASNAETQDIKVNRKFGYCEIKWEIVNYLSGTCSSNWIINSPEFSVRGSQITKWRLLLKPKYLKGKYSVDVYLHRVEYDCFRDPVRVKWKLYYTAVSDIEYIITEGSGVFGGDAVYGFEIPDMKEVERTMRQKSSDTMWIRCVVMVVDKDGAKCFASSDLGLKALSQDMATLYRLNKRFDVILKVGKFIRAHRAILCARNKALKSRLREDSETIEIGFDFIEENVADNLIAFLYSGNLDYVLRLPSFEMKILIDYFKILELKNYFTRDELIIQTVLDMQEIETMWLIPRDRLMENEILSDTWKIGFLDTSFRLRLVLNKISKEIKQSEKNSFVQPKPLGKEIKVGVLNVFESTSPRKSLATDNKMDEIGRKQNEGGQVEGAKDETTQNSFDEEKDNKETNCDVDQDIDYVSIYCEFVNGIPPKEAYLTYGVHAEDRDFCIMEGVNGTLDRDNKISLEKFFFRRILTDPKFNSADQFKVLTNLKIPTGTQRHRTVSSRIYCMGDITEDYHYENLSKNLRTLLETAENSDLVITARVVSFPAHKVILSARSHVLSRLISDLRDGEALSIEELDVHILQILLKYIYTGKLEDYGPDDVTYIYEAAVRYGLWSLKYTCSAILRKEIYLTNALDILVLAHKNKDFRLKLAAFKFICHNMEEVQFQDTWDPFLDENPRISRELVDFGRRYSKALKENKLQQKASPKRV